MTAARSASLASVRWVCLDVGEVLVDETRAWGTWADVLGISRLTFFAALGAVIERGLDHRAVFDRFGIADWRDRIPAVEAAYGGFRDVDLYPDARRSVAALRSAGFGTAILGNQPASRHDELLALDLVPDVIAMSAELGVAKPDPAFFERAPERMGHPPASTVAYVGDRLDNDVGPARAAGMVAVWIRRGPWGLIAGSGGDVPADLVVDSLDELVTRLRAARD